jgi:hypothetical protein
MAFKVSNKQLTARDNIAVELRKKANALNLAIATFNREVEPFAAAVANAQADYNVLVELARNLTSEISEAAQDKFDAKSQRWQDSDHGVQVRLWIERWQVDLDDVHLDLPEWLEEIDPEEHAGQLEAGVGKPAEMEQMH